MKFAVFAASMLLCGCVTMGAEPISVGPDTYQLSMTGVGFATQANTNMKALKAASDFCAKSRLRMMPRHSDESGVYGFSPRQNSLVFMCLAEADPRYQSRSPRKDLGEMKVESH